MSRRRSSVSGAGTSQRIRSDIESLNYDIDASSLFEAELQRQPEHVRRAAMAQRWLVTSAVGCVTGCFAYGIDIGAKKLVELKWYVVFLSRGSDDDPSFWPMFAVYCLYTSALASVATASQPLAPSLVPSAIRLSDASLDEAAPADELSGEVRDEPLVASDRPFAASDAPLAASGAARGSGASVATSATVRSSTGAL